MKKVANKKLINELKGYVGKKISKEITTGVNFFTDVYKRHYNFKIKEVKYSTVTLDVTTYDICPSGFMQGGTKNTHHDIKVKVTFDSINELLCEIVCKINPNFVLKYGIKENMLK